MPESFDDFISSLTETSLPAPTKRTQEQRFPCGQCHGTGRYQGIRTQQTKSHCFACKGTGFFKTDPRKLQANKAKRHENKAEALRAGLEHFQTHHPLVWADLKRGNGMGYTFASSLWLQLTTTGSLSDKQINAVYAGIAKREQIAATKAAEAKAAPVVDLSPIKAMFDRAVENGYKKPAYRAEGLTIKRAPDHGSNAGALYVVIHDTDAYQGKVLGGQFHKVRDAADSTLPALLAIAADPLGAAVRYGNKTGTCSCCGRPLSNAESVALGIGPICRAKWF